jgi:hypothetical protein
MKLNLTHNNIDYLVDFDVYYYYDSGDYNTCPPEEEFRIERVETVPECDLDTLEALSAQLERIQDKIVGMMEDDAYSRRYDGYGMEV